MLLSKTNVLKLMQYWFTPDIRQMQKLRDNCKRKKQWTEYKKY